MNIARDVLSRYLDTLPTDIRSLRDLMDDTGLEVKRVEGEPERAVFGLELLANRGDHHCYAGVAQELAGRLGGTVRWPERTNLGKGDGAWTVQVQTELCMLYSATLLVRSDEASAGMLPTDTARVLEAAGIHSLSLAVDATNLSNLELGQPTHAFDADTIVGAVCIRLSVAGEQALPLFADQKITLAPGTLVIADAEKILAIAGVIGCEESKTTDATQRILLESAAFDPVAVRKASRQLGIHTDASARFERGSDPSRVLAGAGRVVHLLEAHGPWSRAGDTVVAGDWADPGRQIRLNLPWVRGFLDLPLPAPEVCERLGRYGFVCTPAGEQVQVRVPPHRLWDVAFPADLAEELAKSIGYNQTPIGLPQVDAGAVPSPQELRRESADQVLVGLGFYEVVTDGFYGRDLVDRLGLPEGHALHHHVQTQNSLDRAYSLLKNNCLAQAIEAAAVNTRVRQRQIKAFEWTRTFHPVAVDRAGDPEQSPSAERAVLWAMACGTDVDPGWGTQARPADAVFMKGVVAELGRALGLRLTVQAADPDHVLRDLLHPGRQASIWLDDRPVGILGEVHPSLRARFKLKKARPVYLEMDGAALLNQAPVPPEYIEPDVLQQVDRSLAFTLPHGVGAGAVRDTLLAHGPAWLEQVRITDLFAHLGEDGAPLRTVTFALRFGGDSARTGEAVNQVLGTLIDAVATQHGDAGVVLRT